MAAVCHPHQTSAVFAKGFKTTIISLRLLNSFTLKYNVVVTHLLGLKPKK